MSPFESVVCPAKANHRENNDFCSSDTVSEDKRLVTFIQPNGKLAPTSYKNTIGKCYKEKLRSQTSKMVSLEKKYSISRLRFPHVIVSHTDVVCVTAGKMFLHPLSCDNYSFFCVCL